MQSPDMMELLERSDPGALSINPNEVREVLDAGASGQTCACLMGLNILVVEDNEINCEIVKLVLESAGASVVLANDGRAGVEAFAGSGPGEFDFVLMDLRMPVMSGLEAARIIRGMKRPDAVKVPIIALSSDSAEEDVRAAKESGMNEHLAKPVNIEKLYTTLRSMGR